MHCIQTHLHDIHTLHAYIHHIHTYITYINTCMHTLHKLHYIVLRTYIAAYIHHIHHIHKYLHASHTLHTYMRAYIRYITHIQAQRMNTCRTQIHALRALHLNKSHHITLHIKLHCTHTMHTLPAYPHKLHYITLHRITLHRMTLHYIHTSNAYMICIHTRMHKLHYENTCILLHAYTTLQTHLQCITCTN